MKNLTIKQISQQASNLLGIEAIEDNISLFSSTEEGGINWLAHLNMSIDEIFKDIFNKNVLLDTSVAKLLLQPANSGYYMYSIRNLPIVKILSVQSNNRKFNKVVSYNGLDKYSYMQKNTFLETVEPLEDLSIEYLDSRIFSDDNGNLADILIKDSDIVTIDNTLVIYKLCELVALFKSLPNPMVYQQKYRERLAYVIQDCLLNRKPLRL